MVGVALFFRGPVPKTSARNERPQMHEPGRSRRPSNPSVLLPRRSFQWSFAPPRNATKRRGPLHSQKHFFSKTEIGHDRCFPATGVSIGERSDPSPQGLVNHENGIPISAAFSLRYRAAPAAWVGCVRLPEPAREARRGRGNASLGFDGDSAARVCGPGRARCYRRGRVPVCGQLRVVR